MKFLIALLALALFAADAAAGPVLSRLRERRVEKKTLVVAAAKATVVTGLRVATAPAKAVAGCATGNCPLTKK